MCSSPAYLWMWIARSPSWLRRRVYYTDFSSATITNCFNRYLNQAEKYSRRVEVVEKELFALQAQMMNDHTRACPVALLWAEKPTWRAGGRLEGVYRLAHGSGPLTASLPVYFFFLCVSPSVQSDIVLGLGLKFFLGSVQHFRKKKISIPNKSFNLYVFNCR